MFVGDAAHDAPGGSAGPGRAKAASGSAEPPPSPSELPTERLEAEITTLAAHINAGACRFLELVAEYDRRGGWEAWGLASCAHWVAWQCGLTPRTAREHVRVARALDDHPAVHQAFARGQLSYSKVRALTRMADGYSEDDLMNLAHRATAAQLERISRAVRRISAAEADDAHANRYFSYRVEEDGAVAINGRLPVDDAAVLVAALDAARDELWADVHDFREEGGSAEPSGDRAGLIPTPEPRRVTNADALLAMCERSLSPSPSPSHSPPRPSSSRSADRYQVIVHVDERALTGELPPPPAIEGVGAVSAETARRLACDASIVELHERDGKPLSVSRKTRKIPTAIRRALGARDPVCRYPGCERRRFLDAHHVHHWAHGGETKLDNLINLCRHHHRLVHEGGCSVSISPDGSVSFRGPEGRCLPPAPLPALSHRGALAARSARAGLPIDAHTNLGGTGEKLDLDLAVYGWDPRRGRASPSAA